jgi:hypothetical protein
VDLTQLTEGVPCPNRLSSRIIVLQTELRGVSRRFGVLAERVGLREHRAAGGDSSGETAGPAALGTLSLDEQGVFQLIDPLLLVPDDRQAVLFPNAEKEC